MDQLRPLSVAPVGCLLVLLTTGACQESDTVTTTRNLLRPGPMAMACVGRAGDAGVQTGLPMDRCPAPEDQDVKCDAGVCGALFGMVANTARGDVAFFRTNTSGEPLVDLDRSAPGFGFVPVGKLPRDLAATSDGCRAVSVNAGSCDISLIDVPGVIRLASGQLERPGGGLVSTVVPHTAAGPLGARPESVVIVPGSVPDKANEQLCKLQTAYRAYVTFPTCGLVAEIDLRDGKILRGMKITKDGFVADDNPTCPLECGGVPQVTATEAGVDGGAVDGAAADGARDAGVDAPSNADGGDAQASDVSGLEAGQQDAGADTVTADSGAGDGPAGDGAVMTDGAAGDASVGPIAPAGVLPSAMALTSDGSKLFVSSAGANFISMIEIGADGSFGQARRVILAGDRASTQRLAISPPSAKFGQFLYAVAADRSVRVVALDSLRECETNVEILGLASEVEISEARCYPVGSKARSFGADGPGITFGQRMPVDVSFATVARDSDDEVPATADDIEATPLVGVFAFVATNDGNVFVIDIEDQNRVAGDASKVSRLFLPHRVRNALQGQEDSAEDPEVSSITGAGSGGVPVVVDKVGGGDTNNRGVFLRSKASLVASTWLLGYEALVSSRASGQLKLSDGEVLLGDKGAGFCAAGARGRISEKGRALRHGDIVEFVGCEDDDGCGLGQTCARVVGQESSLGLCVDKSRKEALTTQCNDFLRGKREFLVRKAFDDRLIIDVLPLEPQPLVRLVEPQAQQPTDCTKSDEGGGSCDEDYICSRGEPTSPPVKAGNCYKLAEGSCTSNDDCPDHFLCALVNGGSRNAPGLQRLTLTKGQCFRPGCLRNEDCPTGICEQPLDGSPKVCAAARIPLEQERTCKTDADCEAPASGLGEACSQDLDCDPRAECRSAASGGAKRCESKAYTCEALPGRGRRCVRPSPCFAELQRYDVRAGRSFVVGTRRRIIADPQSGECVADAQQSPLFQDRIPIGLPVHPVVLGPRCTNTPGPEGPGGSADNWVVPEPNPCVEVLDGTTYTGYRARGSSAGEQIQNDWGENAGELTTVVHYANPDIQLMVGVGHLMSLPTIGGGVASYAPMPERDLIIEIDVQSGYAQLVAPNAGAIALPHRLVTGADARLYIADMGDASGNTGTTRGQVLRWRLRDLALESFQVK